MNAILIVHNAALEQDVHEVLDACGADCFTTFPHMTGKGQRSDPHLNTEVWPESNCGTLVVAPPEQARHLLDGVRQLRQTLEAEGVKAFMWTLAEVV